MSLRIIRAASQAERSDDLHVARMLVLLLAAGGKKGKKTVEGITKLAKMDFLLRYPNCLERVLKDTGGDIASADVKPYERNTVESKMIRFRYGPWDGRYRRWIGILVAKGLVSTYAKGRTVHVLLTDPGREIADAIAKQPEFADISNRSGLVVEAVGHMSATRLKEFVYKEFPEIVNLRWGQEIEL
ncbi:MAG: hypothetical protein QOF78_2891 [Phycisphaerales bacterium]|jgi:hypothetical protein|nr:hypothetical protein [Phycisphaerales bacterium]